MVFGCLAVFMPIATVLAMVIVFGAYATIDGIFHLVAGIDRARSGERWGGLVLSGVLGITAGMIMLLAPHLAMASLMLLLWATLSAWAMASGVALITAAVRLRREIHREWFMTINGAILLLLGIAVLVLFWNNPEASILTLGFFISLAALCSGGVNLLLANKLFRQTQPIPAKAAR
jgi:uncharacterized membrane protein HdeD (DUF308 family)